MDEHIATTADPVTPPEAEAAPDARDAAGVSETGGDAVEVSGVEFPPLKADASKRPVTELNRFFDVSVTVTVELGRITLPIGELLQLGEGAILELDRLVSEPAEVLAQGVLVARGEIVVVDDRYAIRIQKIEADGKDSAAAVHQVQAQRNIAEPSPQAQATGET